MEAGTIGGYLVVKKITEANEQFRAVKHTTNLNEVDKCTGTTHLVIGVTDEAVTASEYTDGKNTLIVRKFVPGGEYTVVVDGAVDVKDKAKLAADGKFTKVAINLTPVAQDYVGEFIEAATADGDEVLMHFFSSFPKSVTL